MTDLRACDSGFAHEPHDIPATGYGVWRHGARCFGIQDTPQLSAAVADLRAAQEALRKASDAWQEAVYEARRQAFAAARRP